MWGTWNFVALWGQLSRQAGKCNFMLGYLNNFETSTNVRFVTHIFIEPCPKQIFNNPIWQRVLAYFICCCTMQAHRTKLLWTSLFRMWFDNSVVSWSTTFYSLQKYLFEVIYNNLKVFILLLERLSSWCVSHFRYGYYHNKEAFIFGNNATLLKKQGPLIIWRLQHHLNHSHTSRLS